MSKATSFFSKRKLVVLTNDESSNNDNSSLQSNRDENLEQEICREVVHQSTRKFFGRQSSQETNSGSFEGVAGPSQALTPVNEQQPMKEFAFTDQHDVHNKGETRSNLLLPASLVTFYQNDTFTGEREPILQVTNRKLLMREEISSQFARTSTSSEDIRETSNQNENIKSVHNKLFLKSRDIVPAVSADKVPVASPIMTSRSSSSSHVTLSSHQVIMYEVRSTMNIHHIILNNGWLE